MARSVDYGYILKTELVGFTNGSNMDARETEESKRTSGSCPEHWKLIFLEIGKLVEEAGWGGEGG